MLSFCGLFLFITLNLTFSELNSSVLEGNEDKTHRINQLEVKFENYVAKGRREPKAAQDIAEIRYKENSDAKVFEIPHIKGYVQDAESVKVNNKILRFRKSELVEDENSDDAGDDDVTVNLSELRVDDIGNVGKNSLLRGDGLVRDAIYWSQEAEGLVPKGR